jgi:Na+-driven multidrug efflux pump
MSYMPILGFSVAATTLVGQSIGAKRASDAWSYSRICVICGLVIMTVMAAVLFLFPAQLIALFTKDPDVIQLASTTLRAYVWALPFFAISIISVGAMRGAGDTRVPFYYAMTGMWLLRLPLALIAVLVFNLGLPAVWIAMGVDLTFRGITMGRRLLAKAWLNAATTGIS